MAVSLHCTALHLVWNKARLELSCWAAVLGGTHMKMLRNGLCMHAAWVCGAATPVMLSVMHLLQHVYALLAMCSIQVTCRLGSLTVVSFVFGSCWVAGAGTCLLAFSKNAEVLCVQQSLADTMAPAHAFWASLDSAAVLWLVHVLIDGCSPRPDTAALVSFSCLVCSLCHLTAHSCDVCPPRSGSPQRRGSRCNAQRSMICALVACFHQATCNLP